MIFGDLRTTLVAIVAILAGLVLGNVRGEWVGYGRGFASCQETNRKATEAANKRAEAALDALHQREADEVAAEAAARATVAASPDDDCRDLTPDERTALDLIGVE